MISIPYALWLMPDSHTREILVEHMSPLASALAGPSFTPHLTLASGQCSHLSWLMERRPPARLTSGSLSIPIQKLALSENYFQAFAFDLTMTTALQQLHEQAVASFGAKREWRPHVSLAYTNAGEAQKLAVWEAFNFPLQALVFDRCEIWLPDVKKGWQAVALWQPLDKRISSDSGH